MLNIILFTLLSFVAASLALIGLAIYGMIAGEYIALDVETYLLCLLPVCIGAACIYRLCVSRKDAKSSLYKELQTYIDGVASSVPELADLKVKLHFVNLSYFQGIAIPKRHVFISRPWVYAASISKEALEYAKLTLCHELYHISCRHKYPLSLMPLLAVVIGRFYKPFRDNYFIKMWHEELNADRMAVIWHGDKNAAIAKMEAFKNLCGGKESLTDHPSWDIRIRYLREDIIPTMENVTTEYRAYCTYLNNKCRK